MEGKLTKEELEKIIHSKRLGGHKPCIVYEEDCDCWAGCPCVYYKAESEGKNDEENA